MTYIIIVACAIVLMLANRHVTVWFAILTEALVGGLALLVSQNLYTLLVTLVCICVICVVWYRLIFLTDNYALDYHHSILSISAILAQFNHVSDNEIVIGKVFPASKAELPHNKAKIKLDDTILAGGTLITGSTGSGKTTTLKSIMMQNINRGKPVVFFDYKGDTDILDDLEVFCTAENVPYYEFSSRRCTFSYDPLANLNETGRVEALMNTRRWSADGADEHYKTSTQLAIQSLIRAYDSARVDNENYIVGLRKFANTYHPATNERDGFNTLVKQLDILLSSKASELFSSEHESFSFEDLSGPAVICFSFISANKALANSLSSFTFQDILDRGTRRHYENNLTICIDEFGTLESSTLIKDILEKGRSGGCQTVFSILDINQLAMTSGEYFVNAILGTINTFIIHAGATQQTADLLAGVQKYSDRGYSIMNLRKPYKHKAPTALFISKYPILSKDGTQEMYRIIPYIYKSTNVAAKTVQVQEPATNALGAENAAINLVEAVHNTNDVTELDATDIDAFL